MIPTITYPPKFPLPAMGGYRYFFNGQEADNEVLGEGALHAFEYRMHDTRIGRFWSVDPLAGKFPWNSVYAFAENRVVDGMELEGLEYLDADVCRWVFQSDGAYINTENLSPLCKKMYMASVKDINNWTYNSETGCRDIGISTKQHSFQFMFKGIDVPIPQMDNTYGATNPAYNSTVQQITVPGTKSSNYILPDKRYKPQIVGGPSSSTRYAARGMLVITVLNETFYYGLLYSAYKENQIIKKQEEYVQMVEKDIDKILKDPNQQFIPQKYMNPRSLAKIMNVILFGKNYTEDPKIYEIGIKIFNQTGRMRPLDPNRNKE